MSKIKVKEKDLVLVRLNNHPSRNTRKKYYNVWLRVEFIDSNNIFLGRIERKPDGYKLHDKGCVLKLNTNTVVSTYNKNDGCDWCSLDNVTRCDYKGHCRNK